MDELEATLRGVFRDEAVETLDDLAQAVEELAAGCPAEKRQELIQRSFRLAHNLKGAARVVGFESVETVAHSIEDALSPYRESGEPPPDILFQQILGAITTIGKIIDGEDFDDAAADRTAGERAPAPDEQGGGPGETGAAVPDTPDSDPGRSVPQKDRTTTVRVEVHRLDSLMAKTGELLTSRARLQARQRVLLEIGEALRDASRDLTGESRASIGDVAKSLDALAKRDRRELQSFSYLTDEINDATKRVRMLPLADLAPVWRRTVREAAQETTKGVQLTVEVGDLELDKNVLDGLRDPLMHILRNAVGHGIEDAADRARLGKPDAGTILIRGTALGAMAELAVSDDGGGIDAEKVGREAVSRGFVTAAQLSRLEREEVLALLFTAGFSTAGELSRLSGRGVGLDVVRKRVEELGGTVAIADKPELGGTTFLLNVPVSLVSMSGLLVSVGGQIFALPIDHVERTMRIETSAVETVDGAAAVRLPDAKPLRICWLAPIMGQTRTSVGSTMMVVVVSRGGSRLGLVVDFLVGEEKFVTKRLPWNLKRLEGVNGAVILGDGTLAIVVDVPEVFDQSARLADVPLGTLLAPSEKRLPAILVVDDSLTSRTLEQNILAAAGYDVLTAVDGEEAWGVLQQRQIDLVVADIEMPRVDGIELTERIRDDEQLKDLPVIIVSSLGDADDIARGGAAGADEYVVKGKFDQRKLLEAVTRLLSIS